MEQAPSNTDLYYEEDIAEDDVEGSRSSTPFEDYEERFGAVVALHEEDDLHEHLNSTLNSLPGDANYSGSEYESESEEEMPGSSGSEFVHGHLETKSEAGPMFRVKSILDESDEDEGSDSDEEVAEDNTGVHEYIEKCKSIGCAPVSKFCSNPRARSLDLNHRGLGNRGLGALKVAFEFNSFLQSFHLGDNNIDANGATGLLESICNGPNVIKRLNLSENPIGMLATRSRCAVDWKATLTPLTSLQALLLANCKLRTGDVEGIMDAIKEQSSQHTGLDASGAVMGLHALDLSNNKLADAAGLVLGEGLPTWRSAMAMNLSWNMLGAKGVTAIANGASASSAALTSLNLSWNRMADQGFAALAQAVSMCPLLRSLDVGHNNITAKGCAAMARVLAEGARDTLLDLSLDGNNAGDEGAKLLVAAIPEAGRCEWARLSMKDCGVSSRGSVPSGLLVPDSGVRNVPDLAAVCTDVAGTLRVVGAADKLKVTDIDGDSQQPSTPRKWVAPHIKNAANEASASRTQAAGRQSTAGASALRKKVAVSKGSKK